MSQCQTTVAKSEANPDVPPEGHIPFEKLEGMTPKERAFLFECNFTHGRWAGSELVISRFLPAKH